jgi:hypothetical protein
MHGAMLTFYFGHREVLVFESEPRSPLGEEREAWFDTRCQSIVYLQYRHRHVRIRVRVEQKVYGIVREVETSCSSNPSYFNWLIILRQLIL